MAAETCRWISKTHLDLRAPCAQVNGLDRPIDGSVSHEGLIPNGEVNRPLMVAVYCQAICQPAGHVAKLPGGQHDVADDQIRLGIAARNPCNTREGPELKGFIRILPRHPFASGPLWPLLTA